MNDDIFQGKWKQVRGEVQKQWGKLTNDDVDVIEGERTKLEGRLQERYGYTKDEARREVDDFIRNL
ncbi:MAG TPA: CsbD family protein [Anaerolineae bacterium]|nr:CsbD family protein [Anaerolineae bacterium]MCB0180132.1 CsbD family protein [Anaerolineae bacterium]MCB0223427.1 CsbD family protein [Anaerolineae bacterium]MCB9103860.1 CsbD family protein [Anaerolineales bacterium]HRV94738.1 CsbD family protein [Anaerolineae bacterium]